MGCSRPQQSWWWGGRGESVVGWAYYRSARPVSRQWDISRGRPYPSLMLMVDLIRSRHHGYCLPTRTSECLGSYSCGSAQWRPWC
jgi:hypothetical protein